MTDTDMFKCLKRDEISPGNRGCEFYMKWGDMPNIYRKEFKRLVNHINTLEKNMEEALRQLHQKDKWTQERLNDLSLTILLKENGGE